jgi:DNA-binding XRE family transcriptional regulator
MRLEKFEKRTPVPFAVSVKKNGKTIKVNASISAILDDGGEPSFDAISFREIAQVKARTLGVLGPFDFESLRERLKATQKQMALSIFCGAKSYTRWETGRSLPSKMVSLFIETIFRDELELRDYATRIEAEFTMEKSPPWQMQTCYVQVAPEQTPSTVRAFLV